MSARGFGYEKLTEGERFLLRSVGIDPNEPGPLRVYCSKRNVFLYWGGEGGIRKNQVGSLIAQGRIVPVAQGVFYVNGESESRRPEKVSLEDLEGEGVVYHGDPATAVDFIGDNEEIVEEFRDRGVVARAISIENLLEGNYRAITFNDRTRTMEVPASHRQEHVGTNEGRD